jgi:hypothetical protein
MCTPGEYRREDFGSAPIQPFVSMHYQKLPHPFSHKLKELPQVDGSVVKSPVRIFAEGTSHE